MKGLTPVVAIVLTLMVAISIAGTAMVFLYRTQQGLTEKGTQELNRTVGRLFTELKVESFDKDTGTVYIRNDGIETVPGNQVVIYVDDNPVQILSSENIKPNLVGRFVINMSGIEPGEHVLKVSGGGTGGSLLFTIPGFVDNPPSITHMSPSDGHIFNSNNVLLSCNATDDHDIENITLYLNLTGTLSPNETVNVPGLGNKSFSTTFSKTLNSGYYKWNCHVCDNSSQCSWSENRTFAIDLIPGVLQIRPSDGSTTFSPVMFNCSATDDFDIVNISLYANFSGTMELNETRTFSGTDDKNVWANFTKDLPDGTYQWYCEACDSSGQCNITDNRTVKVTSVVWHFSEEPYRQPIDVTEQSGSTLTDYQVLLDLNSTNVGTNFDWSNNGNDLRFTYYNITSGTETEIPYWIESWDSSTEKAKIWVKVPYIPAGGVSKIYMYYGNGSLSGKSNGTAVFNVFIDFSKEPNWHNGSWYDPSYPWSANTKDSYIKWKGNSVEVFSHRYDSGTSNWRAYSQALSISELVGENWTTNRPVLRVKFRFNDANPWNSKYYSSPFYLCLANITGPHRDCSSSDPGRYLSFDYGAMFCLQFSSDANSVYEDGNNADPATGEEGIRANFYQGNGNIICPSGKQYSKYYTGSGTTEYCEIFTEGYEDWAKLYYNGTHMILVLEGRKSSTGAGDDDCVKQFSLPNITYTYISFWMSQSRDGPFTSTNNIIYTILGYNYVSPEPIPSIGGEETRP